MILEFVDSFRCRCASHRFDCRLRLNLPYVTYGAKPQFSEMSLFVEKMEGWMNDVKFYILSNTISAI